MVDTGDYYVQLAGVAVLGGLAFLARILWIWWHQGPEAAHEEISRSRRPSPAPSLAPPTQFISGRRSVARRSASDPIILEPVPRISVSDHRTRPSSPVLKVAPVTVVELGELPGQVEEPDPRVLEADQVELAENQRASLNSSLAGELAGVISRWKSNRVGPAPQEESPA